MKRNPTYLGGTLLVIGLGLAGGYYVFAGSSKPSDPTQAENSEKTPSSQEVLSIDVPPIAPESGFEPVLNSATPEPTDRYASGQSPLGVGPSYLPPPVAGTPDEGGITTEGPASVRENPVGLTNISTEGGSEATREVPSGGGQYELPDSNLLITRGQGPDSTSRITGTDPANSLRNDARAAFDAQSDETQSDDTESVADDSRYGGSIDTTTGGAYAHIGGNDSNDGVSEADSQQESVLTGRDQALYDAMSNLETATGQASPPAPIAVAADNAEPLQNSPTAAQPSYKEPTDAYGIGVANDRRNSATIDFGSTAATQRNAREPSGSSTRGGIVGPISRGSSGAPAELIEGELKRIGENGSLARSESGGLVSESTDGTGRPGEKSLEGPQAAQLSIEKMAPDEIQVGKQCTFAVVVRNLGRSSAANVRLFDEIPMGTRFVKSAPPAIASGTQLMWELGTIAPGGEQRVEIELLPTNEGEIGSVASVQFETTASARTRCTKPLLELTTEVASRVMIGEQQVVKITLHNPGSGDATGVMLLENVPAGTSHPHGSALEFEVGTLRAGESRDLELVLSAEQAGVVQNQIVAKGDGNLVVQDITEFEIVAPQIAVSVVGPQRKYLELPATFTVAVENRGTAAAKDVELVSKLPEGLEFVSANKFGQYDQQTRSVYWSLAELPPQERGEVELVALPVKLGEQRVQVRAGADLGLTDRAESAVQVEGLAAIKFEVTDVADPIEVGGETSYEIRVVNQGSKAATNVTIIAQFPEGIEAFRAQGETPETIEPGRVVFAPLAVLSPKADTTYRIDVQGVQPGDQRVLVQIMTDELAQPIREEESTRVYSDQ